LKSVDANRFLFVYQDEAKANSFLFIFGARASKIAPIMLVLADMPNRTTLKAPHPSPSTHH